MDIDDGDRAGISTELVMDEEGGDGFKEVCEQGERGEMDKEVSEEEHGEGREPNDLPELFTALDSGWLEISARLLEAKEFGGSLLE